MTLAFHCYPRSRPCRVHRFPVILLFPFLQQFTTPEGGYKFINGRGEVQDADEYIRNSEEKLAQEAASKLQGELLINPFLGPFSLPPSSAPPEEESDSDKTLEDE